MYDGAWPTRCIVANPAVFGLGQALLCADFRIDGQVGVEVGIGKGIDARRKRFHGVASGSHATCRHNDDCRGDNTGGVRESDAFHWSVR